MRSLAIVALAGLVGAGCSVFGVDSDVVDDLQAEKAGWLAQKIVHYSYEYERFCFCPPTGRVVIRVQNDAITSVTVKQTGEVIPASQWHGQFFTMTGLYDYLIDAARRADEMQVAFDRSRHIPTNATIDFITNAIDDELTLNMGSLIVISP